MLQLEKCKFYRIKSNQTAHEVEKVLGVPVAECFDGAIVALHDCKVHVVQPFETYLSIAKIYEIGEDALKKFNGARPLYPTCKIFIPTDSPL